jgi:hypothetical protein
VKIKKSCRSMFFGCNHLILIWKLSYVGCKAFSNYVMLLCMALLRAVEIVHFLVPVFFHRLTVSPECALHL